MSAAVEAAAKALNPLAWELLGGVDHEAIELATELSRGQATDALLAALPHFTEGLAEVLRTHTCEYGDCACGWHPTLGDDDLAKHQAAAITEELKRRIEE